MSSWSAAVLHLCAWCLDSPESVSEDVSWSGWRLPTPPQSTRGLRVCSLHTRYIPARLETEIEEILLNRSPGRPALSSLCCVSLPLVMSRLHNLLRKKKKPDKCGFCHAVIAKDETHSGVFYTVPEEEGGTIHQVTGHRCTTA